MKIKLMRMYGGGHTEIEFYSNGHVHRMGTFCVQIPGNVLRMEPKDSLDIPNEFMNKELGIGASEDPVGWYNKKVAELGMAASEVGNPNNVFDIFMDAVAKFCHYDRRGAMKIVEECSL